MLIEEANRIRTMLSELDSLNELIVLMDKCNFRLLHQNGCVAYKFGDDVKQLVYDYIVGKQQVLLKEIEEL